MKIIKKENEYIIKTHTDANNDLGAFLIFSGIVCATPIYYLILIALSKPTDNLRAGIFAGVILALIGLHLILNSRKKIAILQEKIIIKDGTFKPKITFKFEKKDIYIKLKNYEMFLKAHPVEFWQISLVRGKHEYLIDKRPNHQLEMRGLAEALAKSIGCPFLDTSHEEEIMISPEDLDLPFKERVLKYPQLAGIPIKRPSTIYLKIKDSPEGKTFIWGIASSKLFLEFLIGGALLLVLSFIPFSTNSPSYYQRCVQSDNFFSYYAFGIIILSIIIIFGRYRASLQLGKDKINFKEKLWGIPYSLKVIPAEEVEEINLYIGMRGPMVQVVSDKKIINLRIYNQENARWLSWIIRYYLLTI